MAVQTLVAPQAAKSSLLTVDTLLAVMTEAKGNPKLALSRLQEQGVSVSMPELVDQLKDHLPELKQRMEVVSALELFSLMPILQKTLIENLSALEPKDAVNAYMHLMELIGKSVGTTDININLNDARFAQLPRNVASALALLEATEAQARIIEHGED